MSNRKKEIVQACAFIIDRVWPPPKRPGSVRAESIARIARSEGFSLEPLENRVMLTWTGATSGSTQDASHDYNNLANWSGGVIDDSFDGVAFTANTTLYLSGDHATGTSGLNLNYTGNADLKLMSDSSTLRTLALGGDITGDFGGTGNGQTVTIGDESSPIGLNAGGGVRTYRLGAGDHLAMVSPVLNGMLTLEGSAGGWADTDYDSAAATNGTPGGASFDGTSWRISGYAGNRKRGHY